MARNINLKSIDIKNLPYHSRLLRFAIFAAVIVAILLLAYVFIFSSTREKINELKQEEETLKQNYKDKSAQAANLDKLKSELNQINSLFQLLLKQLPTTAEIPNLIQELNEAATKNGLSMERVIPTAISHIESNTTRNDKNSKNKKETQVIETLPYKITLTGNYDQIIQFVRDIGKLSRIVTINSIVLKPNEKDNKFTLTAVANTYKALNTQNIKSLTRKTKGNK